MTANKKLLVIINPISGVGKQRTIETVLESHLNHNLFDYEKIEISIDETNIASLNLFERAGFIRISKEDELINFVYQRRND